MLALLKHRIDAALHRAPLRLLGCVDGYNADELTHDEIVALLRGPAGSQVPFQPRAVSEKTC
jgi:hypothetical protein